jgi:hypothetical protein
MRQSQNRTRPLILTAFMAPLAIVAGLALHHQAPSQAANAQSATAQSAAAAGTVCHSAHYTLTAEIHAGS